MEPVIIRICWMRIFMCKIRHVQMQIGHAIKISTSYYNCHLKLNSYKETSSE